MANVASISVSLVAKTSQFAKGLKSVSGSLRRFRRGVNNAFGSLAGLGGLVASALSVRSIIEAVDGWTNMNNRIRTVTGAGMALAETQKDIFKASKRSRAGVEEFADTFARIGIANDTLGLTNEEMIRLTETAFKLGVVGGASQQEIARSLVQMTQSFAGGVVRAEEFNSMIEGTPLLVKNVARELGVTAGQLRMMVNSGQLGADRFARALLAASDDADRAFAATTTTIGQQFTMIRNEWLRLVGTISESGATGNVFGEFLSKVIQSLDFLTASILAPKEALEDFRRTMQFMLDNVFPDWVKTIMDFLGRFLEFSITGLGIPDFVDRNVQSSRFVGSKNPLAGLDLEEKNSTKILEELRKIHGGLSNQVLEGSFG